LLGSDPGHGSAGHDIRDERLTLSLSPSPEEDAQRIDQQIEQVRFAE
jgi:hypothetical protein